MAYTTLAGLTELPYASITGNEFVLASDNDTTYKMTVETMLTWSANNTDSLSTALTNKILDDVASLVHANAIHFTAVPDVNMQPGTPVAIATNPSNAVHVKEALDGDRVVAISESVCTAGVLSTFVVSGVIRSFNAVAFTENSPLYFQGGVFTDTPDAALPMQYVGRILDNTALGRLLVNLESEDTIARNIQFTNVGTSITGTDMQSAMTEVSSRSVLTTRLKIASDSIVLTTPAIGDIIGGVAQVEDEPLSTQVKNDYTCSVAVDTVTINFDPLDNLNGLWATVSYYAQV